MGVVVDNKGMDRKLMSNKTSTQKASDIRKKGIGFDFVKQMYELIRTHAPNPEDIEEISLVQGTRNFCLKHERNIGILDYNSEIEGFVKELEFPHQRENGFILLFPNNTIKGIYSKYAESVENEEDYLNKKFFEEVAILTGHPDCCSVRYGNFISSGKGFIDHPFYSESRKRISEDLKMPISEISIEDIRNLILEEKVYPTSLLVGGRIIRRVSKLKLDGKDYYAPFLTCERMLPCSIKCEKAIQTYKEWERFISDIGDLLYPLGLEAYNIGEIIKNRRATNDAIRIKGFDNYKNLN